MPLDWGPGAVEATVQAAAGQPCHLHGQGCTVTSPAAGCPCDGGICHQLACQNVLGLCRHREVMLGSDHDMTLSAGSAKRRSNC